MDAETREARKDGPGSGRTVAITGATGFVGRSIVRELLRRGWSVRALVRSTEKAARVLPDDPGLRLVRGGVLDEGSLDKLMEGADSSIHLIGIIREAGGKQTFQNMHAEATRLVVSAATRASQGKPWRHLQMSAIGVREGSAIPYQATKRQGERAVESSSLQWTILRPGQILGVDGEFMQMATDWVRGKSMPFLFIPYFTPGWWPFAPGSLSAPAQVEDIADAFCTALERDRAIGKTYELAGPDQIPFDQMLAEFRSLVPGARKIPIIGIPGPLAAIQAKLMGAIGLGGLLPFDEGMARMAMEPAVSDSAEAKADLDYDPAGFRESLASYADRL